MKDTAVKLPQKETAETMSALQGLSSHPGWKILTEAVTENIKAIEKIILDGEEKMTAEELQMWRDRRYYLQSFIGTPEMVLSRILKMKSGIPDKLDPDPYPYKT